MLADMLAVKKGRISKDSLLGVQTISSVPDRPVPLSQFQRAWVGEGLDQALVPEKRQPVHVFMEACKQVATGKRGVPSANRITEVLSELVTHDATECVYQITRAVKDKANRVIEHPKAMRMVYSKGSGDITSEPLDPDSYLALREVEEKVRVYFKANVDSAPGGQIRTAVRETLLGLGATRVAERASVYFVPISGYGTVESIQRVLDKLYGGDAYIHCLPWLDTEPTRDIVEKHHVADVKNTCEEEVAEIHNRLSSNGNGPKVRRDYVANKINKRIALAKHIKEYESMLGSEIAEVKEAMSLLDDQIEKLMGAAA